MSIDKSQRESRLGTLSAAADQSPEADSPSVWPSKGLAIASASLCAVLLAALIWINHLYSKPHPPHGSIAVAWASASIVACLGPISLLFWAIVAAPSWQVKTYAVTRRLIQIHAVVAAVITLSRCTNVGLGLALAPNWTVLGILAFPALLIDLAVLATSPSVNADAQKLKFYRLVQLRISGGTVLAIFIWSFVNIANVVIQAQFIAGGKPYCIQVEADANAKYRSVAALLELNGLKMHARFRQSFNGILFVRREFHSEVWHWSYRVQQFMMFGPNSSWPLQIIRACEMKKDFALQLPFL